MDRKRRNFKFNVKCSPIPSEVRVKESWGRNFSRESGCAFLLPFKNVASLFLDKRLLSGDYKKVLQVFESNRPSAYIITCEGTQWTVNTESIDRARAGVLVVTAKGKAIMSGVVDLSKNGEWKCSVNTVYPGVRNRKKVEVTGYCKSSGGGVECGVRGSIEY